MSTETDRELLERLDADSTQPGPENVSCQCRGLCGDITRLRELARKGVEAGKIPDNKAWEYLVELASKTDDMSGMIYQITSHYNAIREQLATAQARIAGLETGIVCALCGSPAYWDDDPNQQVWRHTGCRLGSTELIICDKYGYPIPVRPAIDAARQKEQEKG